MSHPKSDGSRANPFLGLDIQDNSNLNQIEGRYICSGCFKSRKFFCYSCFTPHPNLKGVIPEVKLPIKIDIIKHKKEIDGKSTAAHAAILAPNDIKIYVYPDIPNYEDERVVLIYPSSKALIIPQLFDERHAKISDIKTKFRADLTKGYHPTTLLTNANANVTGNSTLSSVCDKLPITRAVFIDSTWNQSKAIYKDERIRRIPCVVLQGRISQFWRHQKGSPRWYLATVEAVHQFVTELHLNAWGVATDYKGLDCCFVDDALEHYKHFTSRSKSAYRGQYDNLLYFFEHMYKLIHMYYDHDNLYAYKRRMM